ncbi:hypothetical protein HOD29_01570, partial [archaeon]|nr:hypothetical protein [archaeon]
MNNSKFFILVLGMFLLVGGMGSVSAIDNFNISSSISSSPLFLLNGTTGDASFGYNVSAAEDFCISGGNCLSSISEGLVDGSGS